MKRTPMKRSKPLRATGAVAKLTVKPKKCKACRGPFFPASAWQTHCRAEACAVAAYDEFRSKRLKAEKRDEAEKTRAAKEAAKRLGALRAEAQAEFNAYIRERDRQAGYGCICCGAPLEWDSPAPGGKVDAGHYMSRGSAPELAFDERNVNAQRKSCNRPGGASRTEFRQGMVLRWGRAIVEELEGPHELPQLRHDDYRQIRDTYRAKLRALKKGRP